jgi:hypothetical protein
MTWKSWGDHPVIVGIGAISAIVGIAAFVFDRIEKSAVTPAPSSISPTANPTPIPIASATSIPTPEPSPTTTPLKSRPTPTRTPSSITISISPSPSSSEKLVAKIKKPTIGEYVSRKTTASGTFSALSPEENLWVYVQPSSNKRYYPSRVTHNSKEKTWTVLLTIGAEKEEADNSFTICLFAANPDDSNNLVPWVGTEEGTDKLPLQTLCLDKRTVRRR